ncbi:hypothetical protein EJ03DRAFT_329070 [Teratosphaeria nubilosa]|uniref:Alpha/beta hydrolase fold-3 domain-containing protein n=1 Tax=Teratosphaeria nubilosa TaxID=161662 RepID=A0A6G1L592_9PEZI|nr:hypothetical protein EJ03DRAFT_329070 [Teratosphaeria nubilosa]
MPFNTLSVATAVTPSVIETYFSHYFNRGPLKQKPTAHISYHEGLRLIRQFLDYSSRHSVEELQVFTAQWVPAPTWVRLHDNEIAPQFLQRAAEVVRAQLGRKGLEKVGGATWWQWRRPGKDLAAEWIEMKKDFNERRKQGKKCDRCILYVHGGAYYFGSVDEHRYQMQRHARKLKARVLAPRYRLAPGFPFPCGLYDCIATYLYLLEHFPPEQILFAGDSAGGGMVLAMLVTLRDQGCPLPAGTILLSPWVDLTHSFPSVAGDGAGDYIPPHGFHHKPSIGWPPPLSDATKRPRRQMTSGPSFAVELPATESGSTGGQVDANLKSKVKQPNAQLPGLGDNLSITVDGKIIEIKDQIQMYAPNDLLSHPLVSPVMQPSLGGLPPMLIQVGGAELLHDEQVYLAHKAANPKAYPPSDAVLNEYDPRREQLDRYPPTDVQLQVWEDLCHVPHTLSFTRPAKYMYRSVAQFGAWALAHSQHRSIEIQDDDAVSIISDGPDDEGDQDASSADPGPKKKRDGLEGETPDDRETSVGAIGRAGDPLPPFKDHMIRQRVTRHGVVYPLTPEAEMAILALDPASIGAIKPGPVRKWLAKQRDMETRFANEKRKVQKKKAKEAANGYDTIPGEYPPPTALINRRRKGAAPEEKKKGKSWGLAMWSGWGSNHDEATLEREERVERDASIEKRTAQLKNDFASTAGSSMSQVVQPRRENAPPSGQPSDAQLAVPSTSAAAGVVEADDGKSKNKERRTSATSFMSNWTRSREDRNRPRSPYHAVRDMRQAGQVSPGLIPVEPNLARELSATSSTFHSRSQSVSAPTAGSLAPDSEKIPGSQNTYLAPESSRPHNGIMAYPFKLKSNRNGSNPSLATLHSQAVSTTGTEDVAPVEMPTEREMRSVDGESASSTLSSEPVSALPPDSITSSTLTPVSPITTPRAPPFASRNQVFDNRYSVLGPIGADGLPIAPLSPKGSTNALKAAGAVAGPSSSRATDDTPVSPIDDSKAQPFKVRNPVYDARADGPIDAQESMTSSAVPSGTQTPERQILGPGELNEATKNAPFKVRHTVVDPSLASTGRMTPDIVPALPTANGSLPSEAEKIAARAMTSVQAPPGSEPSPHNVNITMPTIVTRKPTRSGESTPPVPPPKDGFPGYNPMLARAGSLDQKGGLPPRKSSTKAPAIGNMAFEKSVNGKDTQRPTLETFLGTNKGGAPGSNMF